MAALQDDTRIRRDGERLIAELSRDWEIWGPNGGYVSAIALRAAGVVAPPDHRPVTLTVQYLGQGAFAEAECVVTPVKQGRSAWLLNVEIRQGGRAFLQAQVWTTNREEGPHLVGAAMPDMPPPSALKTFREHALAHYGEKAPPVGKFWKNIEGKPRAWQPMEAPRSAKPAELRDWYSFVDYQPGDIWLDHARAVVLIDTLLWPTHSRSLAAPPSYIAPSLDLTVWFHEAAGPTEWLLLDACADVAAQGVIHGRGRVWTPDGRPVATGGSNMLVVATKA
jgi:acyl-CoA thioesterase II